MSTRSLTSAGWYACQKLKVPRPTPVAGFRPTRRSASWGTLRRMIREMAAPATAGPPADSTAAHSS
ncbi:hypothetical protein [Nonomuraea sp. GTA35]|uniref:hypothetical protein n=1 Tax=Nonomuraea sp. GTA35 TaxID=1676746 RepID=UPI0035BF8B42